MHAHRGVVKECCWGVGAAGFSKGLPQSPGRLRIVQVLQGFQSNLDKDRNTLKVNTGESAQLLVDLSSFNFHRLLVVDTNHLHASFLIQLM